MDKIDLKQIIESKSPGYFDKYPSFISKLIIKILERLLHLNEINQFLDNHSDKYGLDFIGELFEYIDFGYLLSSNDRERIPSEGKLICIANHPLGALDGLAILKAIGAVRPDIKIVVNDVLMVIDNLKQLFLPYDVYSSKTQKQQLNGIKEALLRDEAVIFFPGSEVSRPTLRGIYDRRWLNGPFYFAKKYQVPMLPIHVKGKNSLLFYYTSLISSKLSMFLLAHEILSKKSCTIHLKIGDPIPSYAFEANIINPKFQTKLLKRHVYRIGKNKSGIFKTEKTIIHPVDSKVLKNELIKSHLLDTTPDGKKIFLVEYNDSPNIVREIARLREVTFRKVGEGTGLKFDFDEYDKYYKHIVVWDDDMLEIVGSYRLGVGKDIFESKGIKGLYNSSLFNFSSEFEQYLIKSIELGRSFIQQKYWRTNALDHLWQGIGAFLSQNIYVEYLFGAVSISDNYSLVAKNLIVYFYTKWFSAPKKLITSKNPFILTKQTKADLEQVFNGDKFEQDFRSLKSTLKTLGYSVPILFRRYTELCEQDGVLFHDFGVDESFSNCVDGLVMLDLKKLKESKRKRYFKGEHADLIQETTD